MAILYIFYIIYVALLSGLMFTRIYHKYPHLSLSCIRLYAWLSKVHKQIYNLSHSACKLYIVHRRYVFNNMKNNLMTF